MLRSRCVLACLAFALLGAGDPSPKGYACGRAKAPIVVDGKLDDEAWREAPWTDDFVDIEGDVKPAPRFRTRAKMTWDDTYFYIAAELLEPHVWGTLTKHDSVIFHDNDFEVFIDPDGDNHEYYELEINALNTEWDLLLEKPYRDGGPAVDAWEIPGLKTATRVNGKLNDPNELDESWTVELAIPWKALEARAHQPIPPKDGDRWRVNFSRVEWEHLIDSGTYKKVPKKPEANWVWSPQGAIDMHRPERWGYVQFFNDPPGKATFRPDPARFARDRLMTIYHAQKAYKKNKSSWAKSLNDLGFADLPPIPGLGPLTIRATPEGFEAEVTLTPGDREAPQVWVVRQDSRLIRKPD